VMVKLPSALTVAVEVLPSAPIVVIVRPSKVRLTTAPAVVNIPPASSKHSLEGRIA
jgi:hypothetical protein